MKIRTKRFILIASLAVSILGYNLWKVALKYGWNAFFYICMALFILGMAALLREEYKGKDKVLAITANVFFWLAVGNLCDELFFDPQSYNWGEYGFAIYVVYTMIRNHNTYKQ